MIHTIETRIRRTVLAAVLLTFLVTAVAVFVANENLENSLLQTDLESERSFMLAHVDRSSTITWDTVNLKAFYLPEGNAMSAALPEIFKDYPVPYSGEIEVGANTYLISTAQVDGGTFFLAKDISLFESREALFHRFLMLLALIVVLAGIALSRITGRRLAAPIRKLSSEILQTAPAATMGRVQEDYQAVELRDIAHSFNTFLSESEQYVKREKSLLGLASHELRTPIAVIAGALDVIEQRGTLSAQDKKPVQRMRLAVDEMAANIDILLKLTRRQSAIEPLVSVPLVPLVHEIVDELVGTLPGASRVSVEVVHPALEEGDPKLIKMLVRNLIQNAVQHTEGHIHITVNAADLSIQDEGTGLPQAYLAYLQNQSADVGELLAMSGLGLFIVNLICERLGWTLSVRSGAAPGSTLVLTFASRHPSSK